MPETAGSDALADRRQFIVVLRLVTRSGGGLVYGEVVDVDTGPRFRFAGWKQMTGAVRRWLDGASASDEAFGEAIELIIDQFDH